MIAFNQDAFLKGAIGDPTYYEPCVAMFVCGSPLESMAGMEGLLTSDFKRSKALLKEAGYDGAPVVLLHTINSTVLTNVGLIAKNLLEQGGFKVDIQPMDFQTLATRRMRKGPPSEGGWSGFMTAWVSIDMMNPLTNPLVNAGCDRAYFGWPCDPVLENLRDRFARAADPEDRKRLAAEIQVCAAAIGTHVPLGQYYQPTAYRSDRLTNVPSTPFPVFWSLDTK
jgi:peptide/nickel transport system substrate-binding protein